MSRASTATHLVIAWLAVCANASAQSAQPVQSSERPAVRAPQDSQALQRMVATERAFAAAAAELGVRDAFLTFFAPNAVQIRAGRDGRSVTVQPAVPALTASAFPHLPLVTRLMWEPFTGQISADGEFGWLTGGYANLDQPTRSLAGQGAYFSVWRRQADGTFKVWLDEGVSFPEVWRDAAPFRVTPDPDPESGVGGDGKPGEAIALAEAAVARGGEPWRRRVSADVRVHRSGRLPVVGREAATQWASDAWADVTMFPGTIVVADSDDLGVVIGGYDATRAGRAEHGTYVRVWQRDVTGRWRIVFETSKPAA